MALKYELTHSFSFNPYRFLNKSRWKGTIGWGPRFSGWETFLGNHSALEFNAMQWVKSVTAVRSNWERIPPNNRLEIRYENLLEQPHSVLAHILTFLGCDADKGFFQTIPLLKQNNVNKWKAELTGTEQKKIKPILTPLLDDLGYTRTTPW